jgi:hypothetical protein
MHGPFSDEERVSSLGELLESVRRISKGWAPTRRDPQTLWFRGQSKRNYPLLPVLYRPESKFSYHEGSLFESFKALGAPHVRHRPGNDWEWYFVARHHALPTRLLDWSESVAVALYFALSGHVLNLGRPDFEALLAREPCPAVFDDSSPVIWVMDAGTLNKASIGEDITLVSGGPRTERYLPDALAEKQESVNEYPIGVAPPRIDERIAAQQGVFTVHGHSRVSLEQFAASSEGTVKLTRILLDGANWARLWDDLLMTGLSALALFPDLDHVASHVTWMYQDAIERAGDSVENEVSRPVEEH